VRALGIDVSVRRGLDIVCLDDRRTPLAVVGGIDTGTLREVVAGLMPDIVCIDSPPAWALAGRSRLAERQLAALGVSSYATPSDAAGRAFYDWMTVGFEVFRAVEDGFPLYREGDPRGHAAEVFPHACAAFLAGRLPEQTESKRAFRSDVLRTNGVEVGRVWTQDQIDAALAALAGLVALEGHHCSVGDPAEGVILLPVAGPPPRLTRSGTTPSRARCLPAVDPTGASRYHGPPLGGLAGGPVAPPGREPRT
jgi:predicted nuclease with RNAse H fold